MARKPALVGMVPQTMASRTKHGIRFFRVLTPTGPTKLNNRPRMCIGARIDTTAAVASMLRFAFVHRPPIFCGPARAFSSNRAQTRWIQCTNPSSPRPTARLSPGERFLLVDSCALLIPEKVGATKLAQVGVSGGALREGQYIRRLARWLANNPAEEGLPYPELVGGSRDDVSCDVI